MALRTFGIFALGTPLVVLAAIGVISFVRAITPAAVTATVADEGGAVTDAASGSEVGPPAEDAAAEAVPQANVMSREVEDAGRRAAHPSSVNSRTMNIGVEAGTVRQAGIYSLGTATLRLLDALDADVVFTVYPAQ